MTSSRFLVNDELRVAFDATRAQTIGIQWTELVIAAKHDKAKNLTHFKMLDNGAKTVLKKWLVGRWQEMARSAPHHHQTLNMATSTAASNETSRSSGSFTQG
uniref:Uncharacterized protein n=1 Tax=Hyaloperonospora arabidopsidis (strain Emoy2) TaxID=559515 RepID=M4BDZ3_HYAAE